MANEQLREYIKNARQAGMQDEHLHAELRKSGWSEEEIIRSLSSQAKSSKTSRPGHALSKSKILVGLSLAVVVIVALVLYSGILPFGSKEGTPADGFTKLILSGEYAQDNFSLTALSADSLGVDPETEYTLTSREDVATDDLMKSMTITPSVDFKLKEKNQKEWVVQLAEPVAPNALIRVAIAATYVDTAGQEQDRIYEWAFQVKDSFKVLHTIPREAGTAVPTDSGIEVTFSHDNFKDYESFFSIEPTVQGRFEKHGRTLVFVPTRLEMGRVYRVTIKKGLPLTDSEETLAEDHSFAFETQTELLYGSGGRSWLRIYQKLLEVSTTESPLVQLSTSGTSGSAVDVKVYALEGEAEYMRMLERRDQLPWWSYSKDYHLEDVTGRKALTAFKASVRQENNVQFLNFPEKLPAGFFLAELSIGDLRDQAWIQVTDAAAYVNVSNNSTIVWATDVSMKRPAANATIELLGTSQKFTANGQGVAVFDTPKQLTSDAFDEENNRRYYFKVSFEGKELILPATYLSRNYGYWSDPGALDHWKYLYTDRPLYQPTDNIQFWGFLKPRNGEKAASPVTMTLRKEGYVDYFYRPVLIQEQNVTLDALGSYIGTFAVKDLIPDTYTLELKVGETIMERKYIQVTPYVKPAYQLTLTPERKMGFAGEEIRLVGKASFFEGTPVPGLSLLFKTPEGTKTVVTDAKGTVDLSYTKQYRNCTSEYNCWPEYAWLSLTPELPEIGDIEANASLTIYGPKVYATTKTSYPEKGRGRVEVKVRQVDLQKIENGPWVQDAPLGAVPAPNSTIEGEVVQITYKRTETGSAYDFINKRSYTTYSYATQQKVVDTIRGVTDAQGVFVYELDLIPETSYRVKLKTFDGAGKYDSHSEYLYYYDGSRINRYGMSNYTYYHLKYPEDTTFSVGEEVMLDYVADDESLPDNGDNHYLFMQFQNGFQEYAVSQNSEYRFRFEQRDIPNVNLSAVYFNGKAFIVSEYGWVGNSIKFDTADKTMSISVTPDKAGYSPGDEVSLTVNTRDAQNRPISAAVNLNLIDEAFYAVMGEQASPIASIYAGIGSGSIFSSYSHRSPVSQFGGAEFGGCFVGGTDILMADGSSKDIENIKVGDRVSTLEDPRRKKKVVGVVSEVYTHMVSEYRIINGTLRVTPEHLVYANLGFVPAGSLKVGDWMLRTDGEKVFVTSIEIQHDLVPVYNFRVDPYHSYFANGYFVHNEKGGGPREFFADAALFQTVSTDSNGSARTTFTLPDNVTAWRVTAQGISSQLDVGVSVSKIPVSLPVFVEASIGSEYLAGEMPIARLRSFGTALTTDELITFSISSPDLGITEPLVRQSRAFQSEFFELPKLPLGTFDVTYALEAKMGKDAVKLPIATQLSRLSIRSASSQALHEGQRIENATPYPMAVLFSDAERSTAYRTLQDLSWSWGSRLDQVVPASMSQGVLNNVFGAARPVSDVNEQQYQVQGGGLTLLPYSSDDLELSARVIALEPEGFDRNSLVQYFFKKLEDRKSTKEEVTLALYGLASLDQPVLTRLTTWLERDDLSVNERLYSALAAFELGDRENARKIYLDVLSQYAQIKEPHIVVKVGTTVDEELGTTALTAVLGAQLNDPRQYGLMEYLRFNRPKETLLNLEELAFVQAAVTRFSERSSKVTYEYDGRETAIDLAEHSYRYPIEIQPGGALTIKQVDPDLMATINTAVPLQQSAVKKDPDISIRRMYYVNGKQTNRFKETDLVEVRLIPELSDRALDGLYQITDVLPSGLVPMTKMYYGGERYDCKYWYPYDVDGQKVKYLIDKQWTKSYCGGGYIKYYARVKTKGSYRAEPAILQSTINTNSIDFDDEVSITIE